MTPTPPSTPADVAHRAADLAARRVPFVDATVVRAQHPTSAHPGDAAIVHADGTIEGFVGGQCVQESVRTAALEVLADEEPLLLRVLPDGAEPYPDVDGARSVVNECLSGGAIEIFLAPRRPAPIVAVAGTSPVAAALEQVLAVVGLEARLADGVPDCADATAVVIASHGHDEIETIRAALDAGVPWVGLVASERRGASVLAGAGLDDEERARVHTPVGIELGARTAPEIALSIGAAIVRAMRVEGIERRDGAAAPDAPLTVIDPICGMTVTVTPTTPHVRHDGEDHWFCAPGCAQAFRERVAEGAA
jgi:xanthine dehydrogenase accessory factor